MLGPGTITRAITTATKVAWQWSLFPETAIRYGLADAVLRDLTGKGAPAITSGGRTAAKQRELRDRFDAGEKGIYDPARCSWHLGGLALDVTQNAANYENFKKLWQLMPGGYWAGPSDPVHFDLRNWKPFSAIGFPKCAW